MPRACTICAHPLREYVDQQLRRGTVLRIIAQRYRTTFSALQRHATRHLRLHRKGDSELARRIHEIGRYTLRVLDEGNPFLALRAMQRLEREYEQLAGPGAMPFEEFLSQSLAGYPDAREALGHLQRWARSQDG